MNRSRKERSQRHKNYFKKKGKFEARQEMSGSCGKTQYKTKKKALSKKSSGENENKGLALYVYKCPDCHYWHLTRNKQY